MKTPRKYPPIADYGFIGDCHSTALVSRAGSIDWCCMPRFDADPCFGRLLGWDNGGFCAVGPTRPFSTTRAYRDKTLVLVTTFRTADGEARLLDFFAARRGGRANPRHQLLRILEGVAGEVEFSVEICPRFDFGEIRPAILRQGESRYSAVGSNQGLLVSGDIELAVSERHDLTARVRVAAGERRRLSIEFFPPEILGGPPADAPGPEILDGRLDETVKWWQDWAGKIRFDDGPGVGVLRSATVLRALGYAPTGAIIAAPTASLPEAPGAERNWDYRFSWIRDSIFTVRALADLGCEAEADRFRHFIQRTSAGNAEDLQVLYGVDGKRRLTETTLGHLEGYRGAAPVRIGNAAERQFQADMYGELLDLAWRWAERGHSLDREYWEFLVDIVETAARRWREPDRGIWEMRTRKRHFVHSKVLCWAALQRGIGLAERFGLPAPLARWRETRDAIRAAVEKRGYDERRGVFVQMFGADHLDAALLLLPQVEFVDWRDERMVRTADAIFDELGEKGLVRRYRCDDGLNGTEGAFLPCSFWLAECFARQGRTGMARRVFGRACRCANDLGLFSEEYAGRSMLGNFPQGLTHLSHISAALALRDAGRAGR